MSDKVPIIDQLHNADGDRARADILLRCPDSLMLKFETVFLNACRHFPAGEHFVLLRTIAMRHVRVRLRRAAGCAGARARDAARRDVGLRRRRAGGQGRHRAVVATRRAATRCHCLVSLRVVCVHAGWRRAGLFSNAGRRPMRPRRRTLELNSCVARARVDFLRVAGVVSASTGVPVAEIVSGRAAADRIAGVAIR
ncbi:hypothetical protein MCHK_09490 [Mesorhizobium huakuii 7653R]|nr:hypothetical protein MCHK_09490 [Mesorhizobium huakuii 7653R]